jgi:flagellar hook assembly protein FlgD
LKQNYPNPFNPQTQIEYFVPRDGHVKLEIFNLLGQKIRTLVDREIKKGTHVVSWDGTNDQGTFVANGIYFCQLEAENSMSTNKMILLK